MNNLSKYGHTLAIDTTQKQDGKKQTCWILSQLSGDPVVKVRHRSDQNTNYKQRGINTERSFKCTRK